MTDQTDSSANSQQEAIAEQALTWFVRLRAKSVSARERARFQAWLNADPSHKRAYAEMAAFWDDAEFGQSLAAAGCSTRLPARRNRIAIRRNAGLWLAAACLMLAAIIYRPTLACWQADYCTGVGETASVQLADGSQLTLNSASAIRVNLRNGLRQVQLERGEVFFEVRRDPSQPFLVEGRYSTTRVLGTRFLVRTDADNDSVSVVGGLVEVSRNRQNPALLKAGDSISVDAERSSEIRRITPGNATAWIKGYASFENAPLEQLIAEIGRYRRGELLIGDAALSRLKVSGRFDIRDTDRALESLQQTLPIRLWRITPWLVVINS